MLTIQVTVPGRVWEDALSPDCSTMQAELGLPAPRHRTVGSGSQALYVDVPIDVARDLAEYIGDRAKMLLGQSISDPYDYWEKRERDTQRSAVKAAAKIRAEIQRAQVVAAEPGGTLDARRFA